MSITQFTMEEVRCFAERQQFEIRPLTFLVGENSTGKTTALACFQVLANYLKSGEVDFNSEPYSIGIFQNIVRNSRPKGNAFKLGFTFEGNSEDIEYTVEFVQKKDGFEPAIKSITIKFIDGEIVCNIEDEEKGRSFHLDSFDKERNQYRIDCAADFLYRFPFSSSILLYSFTRGERQSEGENALANYLDQKARNNRGRKYLTTKVDISVFSTSPIRSCPKRTYDPTREFNDPEGSDVPMRLMRIESTKKRNGIP